MSTLTRVIPPVAEMSDEALIQEVIYRAIGYRITNNSRLIAPALAELRRRLCQSWAQQDQIVIEREDATFIWLYMEARRPQDFAEGEAVLHRIGHALGVSHAG